MLKIPEAPPAPRRRPKLWPTSLGARTLLTLLLGLALVQAAGLTIHAYDRIGLQHQADARDIGMRAMGIYRSVVSTSVSERATALKDLDLGPGTRAALSDGPPLEPSDPTPDELARSIRVSMALVQVRPQNHWHELQMRGIPWDSGGVTIGFLLPEEHAGWLDVSIAVPPPRPWHSPTFLWAFVVMTLCAAALSFWAVRQLTGPVATLAGAAEALGRDVNAPPLPEGGPDEVARAALAFNTMASRIRRFVQDRTFLLAAIGHDLRTPITRLKLRAEFIDDDELRDKFLADLDELDTMVSATGGADGPRRAAARDPGRDRRRPSRLLGRPGAGGLAARHATGAPGGAEAGVRQSDRQRGEIRQRGARFRRPAGTRHCHHHRGRRRTRRAPRAVGARVRPVLPGGGQPQP
jgi:HAMP domain-containing protein